MSRAKDPYDEMVERARARAERAARGGVTHHPPSPKFRVVSWHCARRKKYVIVEAPTATAAVRIAVETFDEFVIGSTFAVPHTRQIT